MVEGVPGLAAPKVLGREEILASLLQEPRVVDVEGLGPVRVVEVSPRALRDIRQQAADADGGLDEEKALLLTLTAQLVDMTREDVEALWDASMAKVSRIVEALALGGDAPSGADFRSEP